MKFNLDKCHIMAKIDHIYTTKFTNISLHAHCKNFSKAIYLSKMSLINKIHKNVQFQINKILCIEDEKNPQAIS